MFKALSINLAASIIYDYSKKLKQKEAVQFIVKKFRVNNELSDFTARYVEALVEMRLGNKPKEVLAYFRDEAILKTFYNFYYADKNTGLRNNESEFSNNLNHYIDSLLVGENLKKSAPNINKEINEFHEIFKQKVHESRTVTETVFFKTINNILKTTSSNEQLLELILKQLSNNNIKEVVNHKGEITYSVDTINNTNINLIIKQAKTIIPKELTEVAILPPKNIVGRLKDLNEIHRMLFRYKQVVVMNGMAGIGKTTIAQVYLHKYWDSYQHIAWITQLSDNIKQDIVDSRDLSDNLNINKELTEPEDIFKEIIRKLSTLDKSPNLLVLDNADFSLEKIRDKLPKYPNWHILITSRQELNGFDVKHLGLLSKKEAFKLFKKHYTRNYLTTQQIEHLVQAVEYHTLLIEILSKTAECFDYEYTELLNAIKLDLKTELDDIKHARTTTIERIGTYLHSIFNVSKLDETEMWLLKQFACLPSDYISYEIVKELIVEESSPLTKSLPLYLQKLVKKGWLQSDKKTHRFKMHRIVKETVVIKQTIIIQEITHLIETITEKLKVSEAKDNPIDKFQWKPYGNTLLEITEKLLNNTIEDENKISLLKNNLALVYQAFGDYKGAKELLEKAMKTAEKNLGPEHHTTAVSSSNLALVLKDLGDYQGAKVLLEKAMRSVVKNFGAEHPKAALSYSNLATVLQTLGDYQGAKELLVKAIKLDENNFGPEHPTTAVSYSNLATVLQDLGDYQGAKELLEKAVKSDEKNFGREHPSTVTRYSNLGLVLKNLGDYQGAKELLEKVMRSAEKNFGKEHPRTAVSYSNLAIILQNLGDYQRAKELLEKAMRSDEKNFGAEHPTTAVSSSNLATVLKTLGDYQGAKELLEKAMESDEKNFGADHPKTAIRYSNLATVLQDLGDYQGAKGLLEKAMGLNEKNFGAEHPTTALTYTNLATILQDLGDYQGAKELLEKAMRSDEKNYGADHPITALSYTNLAIILQDLGEYQGAKVLLEKAIRSAEKNFGEEHPTTAVRYSNLALVLKELGDYQGAKVLSAKSIAIFTKTLPPGHPNIDIAKRIYDSIEQKNVK